MRVVQEEIEHVYTELPTEAISHVELDYELGPKTGNFTRVKCSIVVPVQHRFVVPINTAKYRALVPMSRGEAFKFVMDKAKQLEEL